MIFQANCTSATQSNKQNKPFMLQVVVFEPELRNMKSKKRNSHFELETRLEKRQWECIDRAREKEAADECRCKYETQPKLTPLTIICMLNSNSAFSR